MTYLLVFVLKFECPSQNLKFGLHNGPMNIDFRKLDMSKVDFKYLDSLFGYEVKDDNEEIQ